MKDYITEFENKHRVTKLKDVYLLNYIYNEENDTYDLLYSDGSKKTIGVENNTENELKKELLESFKKMLEDYNDRKDITKIDGNIKNLKNNGLLFILVAYLASTQVESLDEKTFIYIGQIIMLLIIAFVGTKLDILECEIDDVKWITEHEKEIRKYFEENPDILNKYFDKYINKLEKKEEIKLAEYFKKDISENGLNLNNYDYIKPNQLSKIREKIEKKNKR